MPAPNITLSDALLRASVAAIKATAKPGKQAAGLAAIVAKIGSPYTVELIANSVPVVDVTVDSPLPIVNDYIDLADGFSTLNDFDPTTLVGKTCYLVVTGVDPADTITATVGLPGTGTVFSTTMDPLTAEGFSLKSQIIYRYDPVLDYIPPVVDPEDPTEPVDPKDPDPPPVVTVDATGVTASVLTTGFDNPWAVCYLPDGGILVTEKFTSKVRLFKNGVKTDVSGFPTAFGAAGTGDRHGGMMDLIMDSAFGTNRILYFTYVSGNQSSNALRLAKCVLAPDSLSVSGVTTIHTVTPAVGSTSQYGGRVCEGPTGLLFLATGDRDGPHTDPGYTTPQMMKAQDDDDQNGKLLCVNKDGSIPATNPNWNHATVSRRAIVAKGLRNPYGIAIGPDGNVWIADNGPGGGDSINRVRAYGLNFGWPIQCKGNHYGGADIPDFAPGVEDEAWYMTTSGAPSGMTFIKDNSFGPGWKYRCITSWLANWSGSAGARVAYHQMNDTGTAFTSQTAARVTLWNSNNTSPRCRDVRHASDGNLYVITDDGRLVRLSPVFPETPTNPNPGGGGTCVDPGPSANLTPLQAIQEIYYKYVDWYPGGGDPYHSNIVDEKVPYVTEHFFFPGANYAQAYEATKQFLVEDAKKWDPLVANLTYPRMVYRPIKLSWMQNAPTCVPSTGGPTNPTNPGSGNGGNGEAPAGLIPTSPKLESISPDFRRVYGGERIVTDGVEWFPFSTPGTEFRYNFQATDSGTAERLRFVVGDLDDNGGLSHANLAIAGGNGGSYQIRLYPGNGNGGRSSETQIGATLAYSPGMTAGKFTTGLKASKIVNLVATWPNIVAGQYYQISITGGDATNFMSLQLSSTMSYRGAISSWLTTGALSAARVANGTTRQLTTTAEGGHFYAPQFELDITNPAAPSFPFRMGHMAAFSANIWGVPTYTRRARQYYFSNSGNDGNTGTLASPWRSINVKKNAGAILADSEIVILGAIFSDPISQKPIIDTYSTAPLPGKITIRPYETYCKLQGPNNAGGTDGGNAFHLRDQEDVEIYGFEIAQFKDQYGNGAITLVSGMKKVRIIGNVFTDNGSTTLDHGIYISGASSRLAAPNDIEIAFNIINQPSGTGCHIHSYASGYTSGFGAWNVKIHDNLFDGFGVAAFLIAPSYGASNLAQWQVYNNDVRATTTSALLNLWYGDQTPRGGVDSSFVFQDNILVQNTNQYAILVNTVVDGASAHAPTFGRNKIYNPNGGAAIQGGSLSSTDVIGNPGARKLSLAKRATVRLVGPGEQVAQQTRFTRDGFAAAYSFYASKRNGTAGMLVRFMQNNTTLHEAVVGNGDAPDFDLISPGPTGLQRVKTKRWTVALPNIALPASAGVNLADVVNASNLGIRVVFIPQGDSRWVFALQEGGPGGAGAEDFNIRSFAGWQEDSFQVPTGSGWSPTTYDTLAVGGVVRSYLQIPAAFHRTTPYNGTVEPTNPTNPDPQTPVLNSLARIQADNKSPGDAYILGIPSYFSWSLPERAAGWIQGIYPRMRMPGGERLINWDGWYNDAAEEYRNSSDWWTAAYPWNELYMAADRYDNNLHNPNPDNIGYSTRNLKFHIRRRSTGQWTSWANNRFVYGLMGRGSDYGLFTGYLPQSDQRIELDGSQTIRVRRSDPYSLHGVWNGGHISIASFVGDIDQIMFTFEHRLVPWNTSQGFNASTARLIGRAGLDYYPFPGAPPDRALPPSVGRSACRFVTAAWTPLTICPLYQPGNTEDGRRPDLQAANLASFLSNPPPL